MPKYFMSGTKYESFERMMMTPPSNPAGLRIDSKRRRKLMQKRLAMGHKPDDHADPELKQ